MRTTPLIGAALVSALLFSCGDDPAAETPNGDPAPFDPTLPFYPNPYAGADEVEWAFRVDGAQYLRHPALSADKSTIYVSGWDGHLYAVSMEGEQLWSYETGGRITSAPTVLNDGAIAVTSYDGTLYVVDDQGELMWRFDTEGYIAHSAATDDLGRIYVASDDQQLYVLDDQGELLWQYDLEAPPSTSPSVLKDGERYTVFVGSADQRIHCVDATDSVQVATIEGHATGSLSLNSEGRAIAGTTSGSVVAVDADCQIAWQEDHTWAVIMPLAIGAEGNLYAGAHDRHVFRFSPDSGEAAWSASNQIRAVLETAPTLGSDNNVYAGANGLIRIASLGEITVLSELDILDAPLLVEEGHSYVTTERGYLLRLNLELPEMGQSDWPTQHGNQQRTAFLELD